MGQALSEAIENVGYCPECSNRAPQRLEYTHTYQPISYEVGTDKEMHDGPLVRYYVAICSTCGELLLYSDWEFNTDDQHFASAEMRYPRKHELDYAVPGEVRAAYDEAARIKNSAPNAYAVMIRRALEALCADRGISTGTLADRLTRLVSSGEIPEKLGEMTTVLRTLGNAGAHHDSPKVTVPMTWAMDEFFRAIVEYVYVAPKRIADFRSRLGVLS